MMVGYEEGKGKEQVMFNELDIGEISYVSGTPNPNLQRFENSVEVEEQDNLNDITTTTRVIPETKTNYDEVE